MALLEAMISMEERDSADGVTDPGSLFEDGALPRVGLERLALLDAQRLEHGHVEAVAGLDGVVVDDGDNISQYSRPMAEAYASSCPTWT